jgi:HTH-type transcriptional regulator/antitoxin HigA
MDISPIKSQRDYRRVLKEIEGLMLAKRNTPEGDRLDVLVTLVEAWERKHYPMDLPDPVEAIRYHMDQNGLQPRDLDDESYIRAVSCCETLQASSMFTERM